MLEVCLPATASGVDVPARTPGQLAFSALFLIVAIVAMVVWYRRSKFSGLETDQRKHKSALLGSMRNQTPETVRIPATDDVDDHREAVADAFDRVLERARGEDVDHDPDRVTVREALGEVAGEIVAAADMPTVPRAARRVGGVAVLVALLGALAVSTEAIVSLLSQDRGGMPAASAVLESVTTLSSTLVATVTDVLLVFPGGATVTSLLFAYGLLAWTLAYEFYYIVAVTLAIGALAITALDRRVPDTLETQLYYHRQTLALEVVGAMVAVWLAGVVPTAIGQLVGGPAESAGAVVGAVSAVVLLAVIAGYATKSVWKRLSHAATIDWPAGPDSAIAAYLLTRYVAVGLALAAVPLVPVYATVALVDGRVLAVLSALWAADPATQLVVVAVVLGVVALVAWVSRDAADAVRDGLTDALARQAVRAAIFQRAFTVGVWLFGTVALWAWTRSYIVPVVGGVVLAAAVYGGYEALDRAAYRLSLTDGRTTAGGVLIQAYALADADGEYHLVAKIGREHTTAGETVAETVDDAVTLAEAARTTGETVPLTVGRKRAEDLLESGDVDSDPADELHERIRTDIRYVVDIQGDGRASMADLVDALEEYPDERWRGVLEYYIAIETLSRTGDGVRLERDVWGVDDRATPADRWLHSSGVSR